MKEFIVVVFEDEASAEKALGTLRELHEQGGIAMTSVGIAAKGDDGQLTFKDTVGKGAPNSAAGAVIGSLVGLLAGPVGAIAGGAAGAFIGSWRDMTRLGLGGDVVERVSTALAPGKSAVIAEMENADRVEEPMRALGGEVFRRSSATVADEQAARDAERAEAARNGERPPVDDEGGPDLVKGRPMKSAHP